MLSLDKTKPFVEAVFNVLDGKADISKAVSILQSAETSSAIELFSPAKPDDFLAMLPDELFEQFMDASFFGFLDQTHLILPVPWYDNLTITVSRKYVFSATWRGYSALLARWANRSCWLGVTSWHYADFYKGLRAYDIDRYEDWAKIALRVIEVKSVSSQ